MNHVLRELCTIETWVSPSYICLIILVNPNSRVDVVPFAILKEWLAESIVIRTFYLVCNTDTDSHTTANL